MAAVADVAATPALLVGYNSTRMSSITQAGRKCYRIYLLFIQDLQGPGDIYVYIELYDSLYRELVW